MSGRKPFSELTKDWSKNRLQRVEARKAGLREEMTLAELRKALDITQGALAKELDVQQPFVAKLEGSQDARISKVRRVIEAMGGELEIKAHFPEGDVTISNLG